MVWKLDKLSRFESSMMLVTSSFNTKVYNCNQILVKTLNNKKLGLGQYSFYRWRSLVFSTFDCLVTTFVDLRIYYENYVLIKVWH